MNILIIGSGGREHALCWKVAQSPLVKQIFVAPGNAGTALEDKTKNVAIEVDNLEQLLTFAKQNKIDLTIVGPELPLTLGVVDLFNEHGLKIFGPRKNAAILEGSKAFTKDFLARHNIPTADYKNFQQLKPAVSYLQQHFANSNDPIVIKADGLAAGKGVVIAQNLEQATDAVNSMLNSKQFGTSFSEVVIEQFLTGEEASFIVMSDGKNVLPMATSQDHKRIGEQDQGANTGGMGAYSPAKVVTPEIEQKIMQQVIYPTIRGMEQEGRFYQGFLYAGIIITPQNEVKVIEFNARFGDPETQPIMLRLQSDLVELCLAGISQNLENSVAVWSEKAAIGIVMSAKGYPNSYAKDDVITGIDHNNFTAKDSAKKIFFAGISGDLNQLKTSGGRVLCACALGDNITQAQQQALDLVKSIDFAGAYYRKDIGWREIAREQKLN